MPTSIIVTITAMVVLLGVNIATHFAFSTRTFLSMGNLIAMIPLGVGLVLLWGVVVGHRLAWQWGRIMCSVFAVLSMLGAVTSFVGTQTGYAPAWLYMLVGSIRLLNAVGFATIFLALGRPSAKHHFNLQCPSCGNFTSTAADFFFNRAKCKACSNVW